MKWTQTVLSFAVLFYALSGQAALETTIDGSGRLRYENTDNKDFNDAVSDRNQFTGARFRLGAKFQSDENTSVYVQAQYSDKWGSSSAKLSDNVMTVHQAYIKHKINSSFELKLGRQELIYGDHLVIGNVGWSNVGRSFDAAKLRYTHSSGWVDVFTAEVSKTVGLATQDNSFSGVYGAFKEFGMLDEFDVYAFYSVNPKGVLNDDIMHYGLRLKSKMGSLDYRFEGTGQTEISGHQADLELGYSLSDDSKMRVSAEVFTASKDYIQLFPTGHKWLGIGDVLSRRNLNGLRLGFQMKILENLNFKTDYHIFYRQDDAVSAYTFGGGAIGTSSSSADIGSELDVVFKLKLDEKSSLAFGGSMFAAGDYLKANGLNDNFSRIYLELGTKF